MPSTPELPNLDVTEQSALACYLSVVVAIGNCMAEVCPPVGAMYRDRMLKLPRRLGFGVTPQVLQKSREAVETDLIEYSFTARAWIDAGSHHAAQLLDHLRATEETLGVAADLQHAFLEDLAEHIDASAQVDDEAQLRISFQRYAAGLNAYSRRAKAEKLAALDQFRRRREEIEAWLTQATMSTFIDPYTRLLNRTAAERRLEMEIRKEKPFCVVIVAWAAEGSMPERWQKAASGQITKELGDQFAATIRPYDMIFRWSEDQLMTIFDAGEADIAARARQIGNWLGNGTHSVEIAGESLVVKTRRTISLVEHLEGEASTGLIERIEALTRQEVAQ
jgi:GGDEF domain-containing protein